MTHRISSTIAALAITLGVHAYDHADIQGTTFTVDTIEHYYVGPGLTHSHFSFASGSRVFQAYILKLDTKATGAERMLPRVEIGNDQAPLAATSSLCPPLLHSIRWVIPYSAIPI